MSGAHFKINQAANSSPTGTNDLTRLDIYQSQPIHLVGDSSGGQASPDFTILAWPAGSARSQPTNASTFDATYTPDVPGSYRVQFLVDDGEGANAIIRIFAVTRGSTGLIIDDGIREPAYGEETGEDNASSNDRGYAKAYEVGITHELPTVATMAALRARVASRHTQVNLLGYYAANDGGGGLFAWDASSTATDDGGSVIQPTSLTTGRWRRLGNPIVNVLWFGAKGDGTTDDHAAFQAAVDAAVDNQSIYLPPGKTYKIATEIGITDKAKLTVFSDGPGASIQLARNTIFIDASGIDGFKMYGFTIKGTLQTDGGDVLGLTVNGHVRTAPSNIFQAGIYFVDSKGVDIHDVTFEDLGGYAIFPLVGNRNVKLHHNTCLRTQAGIQTGAGGNAAGVNYNVSVTDNYFLANIWAVVDGPAIVAGKSRGSDDQIAVFSVGQCTIARNHIDKQGYLQEDGTTNSGISNQSTAIDVQVIAVADDGEDLNDLLIVDNVITNVRSSVGPTNADPNLSSDQDRPAIQVFGDPGGNVLDNLKIAGNTIRNCSQGIIVYGPGANNLTITGNHMSKIRLNPSGSNGVTAAGIFVGATGACSKVDISGNTINDADQYGIGITAGVSHVTVRGNHINGGTHTAGNASSFGIYLNNVTDLSMADNHVDGMRQYALYMISVARFSIHDEFYTNNANLIAIAGANCTGSFRTIHKHGNTASTIDDGSTSAKINYADIRDGGTDAVFEFNGTIQLDGLNAAGLAHTNGSGLLSTSKLINTDVDAAAAIAYSKLALSNSIVDADVATAAAIAVAKLAAGSANQYLVTVSTTPTWVTAAGDWSGAVGSNTVLGLTGSAGVVAMHGTSIKWDSTGPSIAKGGIDADGLQFKLGVLNSYFTFTDTTHDLLYLGWNGGGVTQILAGGATYLALLANQGTSQYIQIKAAGTTPVGVFLDCDNIQFRASNESTRGKWGSTGLYIGGDIVASDKLEVDGKIVTTDGNYFRWKAANIQQTVGAAGAASALPGAPQRWLKVYSDTDGAVVVVPAWLAS